MKPEPDSTSFVTRESLLLRLRDNEDQAGWREFFDTYWRLIYNVARKSGLADAEAQDVVQNTFIYLSRRMPNFKYDAALGSFKSWLRVVTRSRIAAHFKNAKAQPLRRDTSPEDDFAAVENMPDPAGEALDEVWRREWEANLLSAAMRRVRAKVSARHLMIFRLAAQDGLSAGQVARKLEVSLPQVYLARHRVGKLLKTEVQKLRTETESLRS